MVKNVDIALSVVIATRNRSKSLARMLDRLAEQVDAPDFEIIIGDNGSTDDTVKIVERARVHLKIRYLYEEHPGKGRTLNATLKLARGDLIVFTDDDVQPDSDWLAQLHKASIKYQDCKIFGGQILVDSKNVPNWIRRSFNLMILLACSHDKGTHDVHYGFNEYPFGPNMAIRRNCITSLNKPYPEYIGPGTELPVGDETIFLSQFSPAESKDRIFIAKARVTHEIESENVNFFGALKRCYLAGRTGGILGFSTTATGKSKNISSLLLISQRLIACQSQGCLRLPTLSKPPEVQSSTLDLILARMSSCKSVRELICISARYIGFLVGSSKFHHYNE